MKNLGPPRKKEKPITEVKPLVLYVEDNSENQRVASYVLGKKYDVELVANAKDACAFIHKSAEKISIILMDIELQDSDLNGIQIAQLLRGKLPLPEMPEYAKTLVVTGIPIIFVTAYGNKYAPSILLEAGGNRIISKPVDFVALQMAMTQIRLAPLK